MSMPAEEHSARRPQVPLSHLQPSQLYISTEKLAHVRATFDPLQPALWPPIPVKQLDGRLVMTDGHTRAVAACTAGLTELPLIWDCDELDWQAYRICVAWCRESGIYTVADLAPRTIDPSSYQRLWLDRCARMHRALARSRTDS